MRLSYSAKWILIIFINLLLIWWVAYILLRPELQEINTYIRVAITLFLVIFLVWTIKYFAPSWIKGVEGESEVLAELNKLLPEYLHVNNYHNGKRSDVDFVVIGPTGIFTIEVKNTEPGILTMQNGHLCFNETEYIDKDPLKQAYGEKEQIQEHIRITLNKYLPVTPLLVYANPKVKMHFGRTPQRGVYILGINWLNSFISEATPDHQFTPELCKEIKENISKFCSNIV